MPNLTSVGVTAGVPTSGTGTVSTIDGLIAAQATINAVTATGNALDINVKSGGNANGQAVMSSSAPVTIASDQSALAVNITKVNGATVPVGSGVQATAERVTLATDSPGIVTLGQTTKSASVPVTIASDQALVITESSQYPSGAIPITASTTGTTAATTATLAANATLKTYIAGFAIRSNATAAVTGNATVTGTVTGTLNFNHFTAPVASGIGITEQRFNPPIPSSAVNTAIAVVSPAPGTAGIVSVTAWGYQL